ncbi:hypothetical protein OAF24_04700 [bacterium]|nr:hypothetical protein [bacterium]
MNFQIIFCGMSLWLSLANFSLGQESQEALKSLPPLPIPVEEEVDLVPGQQAELESLTGEELQQIFQPVNLGLKGPTQFKIRIRPHVYLDEEDPSRGLIEPPPMQADVFDTETEPMSLQQFTGNGVESPFFTPVSPFCYPPLYFEEPYLERYGDGYCDPLQTLISGAHFYARIPMLSINLIKRPPCRPVLNLWADPVDEARR